MNKIAEREINDMLRGNWMKTDGMMRPCMECGSWELQYLETDKSHGHQLKYVCKNCGFKSQALKRNPDGKTDRVHQDEWSKAVLVRANGKCQIPGCNNDAKEAHHKASYRVMRMMGMSDYEIWSLENGIALCEKHHQEWHDQSFITEQAYQKKKRESVNEFKRQRQTR